jgi:ABC-type branched-subunit amino acid transport system substrate-binding protein
MRWLSSHRLVLAAAMLGAVAPARADSLIGDPSPMTGPVSWTGEQYLAGTELAVADLNARGGVLGEPIRVVSADDACDPEQAVAAARKLISDGVVLVVGHACSGAAIPTAPLYEATGVIMISPSATNPKLTEQGRDTCSASSAATITRASSPAAIWPTAGARRGSRSCTTARHTVGGWRKRPGRR